MATLSINQIAAKGLSNKGSGTSHTFWQTSFNMPVNNIYDDLSTFNQTEGFFDFYGTGTSFDLSGFQAGWEVLLGSSCFVIEGPFAGGTVTVKQEWRDPDGIVQFTNGPYSYSIGSLLAGQWTLIQLVSNQGVASWEIAVDGTYSLYGIASGAISGTGILNIGFTNVPGVSQVPMSRRGFFWVEGNDLRWTSSNGHIHTMYGIASVFVDTSKKGAIWVNSTTNSIEWIGNDGWKYISKYNFQQFSSTFSNGPSPGVVSGQTPGMAWMDENFGYEHIGYIGNDGYKWICPSGANPYASPPASSTP